MARRGFMKQGNTIADESPVPDLSGRYSHIPALLARLSDTVTKPDGYVTPSNEATAVVEEKKIRTNGMSSPEIMARARALKNDTIVIKPLGSRPSIECGKDTFAPLARSLDLPGRQEEPYASGGFMPTMTITTWSPRGAVDKDLGARTLSGHGEDDTAPPPSYMGSVSVSLDHQIAVGNKCHATLDRLGDQSDGHDDLPDSPSINVANPVASQRFKLLARLETERNQANGGNADPNHTETSSAVSGKEEGGSALLRRSVGVGVDPEFVEMRLRMRAQLQTRLAAEKRGCK